MTAKKVVQTVGYIYTKPEHAVEGVFAARQVWFDETKLPHDRAHMIEVLDIIGCLFTDLELIGRLPTIFPSLKKVTVHDCTRLDFKCGQSLNPSDLTRLPFELDLDFSHPRGHHLFRANGSHVDQEFAGLSSWNEDCLKMPAMAQWIWEQSDRPETSVLLAQATMMQHAISLCNMSHTNLKPYNGKDLVSRYGHGRTDTPFLSKTDIELCSAFVCSKGQTRHKGVKIARR